MENLPEIVKALLLHRPLFYIPGTKNILYPFVLKELYKYGQVTVHSEMFNDEDMAKVISYYQNHLELKDARFALDLCTEMWHDYHQQHPNQLNALDTVYLSGEDSSLSSLGKESSI